MDRGKQGNVTIIKRRKVIAAGHHGGAWKVAYADFVTAMMAFFLLMWLLSVTDQNTRMGLADYFSPTIPIHSTRGGGDGPFEGVSFFGDASEMASSKVKPGNAAAERNEKETEDLAQIARSLQGDSGDAARADPMLRHIRTRVTDEGLIIEIFDVAGSPLFQRDGTTPNPILERLLGMIGGVIARTTNNVAVGGHLAPEDIGAGRPDPWILSSERALISRALLVSAGIDDMRLARVSGKSDRDPSVEDPADTRNRRIEVTLLRRFPATP